MSPKRKNPSSKPTNPIPPEIEPELKEVDDMVRTAAEVFIMGDIPVGLLARRFRNIIFDVLRRHEEELARKLEAQKPAATVKPGVKKIPAPSESSTSLTEAGRKRGQPTVRMKAFGLRKTA